MAITSELLDQTHLEEIYSAPTVEQAEENPDVFGDNRKYAAAVYP